MDHGSARKKTTAIFMSVGGMGVALPPSRRRSVPAEDCQSVCTANPESAPCHEVAQPSLQRRNAAVWSGIWIWIPGTMVIRNWLSTASLAFGPVRQTILSRWGCRLHQGLGAGRAIPPRTARTAERWSWLGLHALVPAQKDGETLRPKVPQKLVGRFPKVAIEVLDVGQRGDRGDRGGTRKMQVTDFRSGAACLVKPWLCLLSPRSTIYPTVSFPIASYATIIPLSK
jgi:hypothetical protein